VDKEETQPETRDLQEERFNLRSLKEHPGYGRLLKIAEESASLRAAGILSSPVEGLDGAIRQEYEKGVFYGIQLFRGFVDARIRDLDERIKEQVDEDIPETDGDLSGGKPAGFDTSFGASADFDRNGAPGF
jgi:hypothetical protein